MNKTDLAVLINVLEEERDKHINLGNTERASGLNQAVIATMWTAGYSFQEIEAKTPNI